MKKKSAKQPELARAVCAQMRGRRGLLRAGERVCVAVSGGADPVALLRLLLEVREELGIVVSVAHFNHQLRGRASDADERFVAQLAAKHALEFFAEREDIGARAKREKANLEEAGRRARYDYFARLVREGHASRVAVAHTADDQAETVLAHLLRGTGLAGLGGIHPEAGVVFRPLLGIRRAELRRYLRRIKQTWREDASNQDTEKTRARIRKRLLPLLEKEFQPGVVKHLCELAARAREDEAALSALAAKREREITQQKDGAVRVALEDLQFSGESGQQAIAGRLVKRIAERVKTRAGQWNAEHIGAVLRFAQEGGGGKVLQLPGGVEVRRERDVLIFCGSRGDERNTPSSPKEQRNETPKTYRYRVHLRSPETRLSVVELSTVLHFREIDWPAEGRETKVTGAVLNRERLRGPLALRNWQPGDAMRPAGHQKRHKLARLLNELGISRWEKAGWPVLTCGDEIAWARGLGAAAEFAADGKTRRGVHISEEKSS